MARRLHIIYAENEKLISMAVSDTLEDAGYRVTPVPNGQAALRVDERDPADVLITDLHMPLLDGHGLIRRMRGRKPDLPILVLTGYGKAMPDEEAGRLMVLLKPCSCFQVERAVERLLTAGASAWAIAAFNGTDPSGPRH